MTSHFVFEMALCMSGIVTGVTITAAVPRDQILHGAPGAYLVEIDFDEARPMPVDQCNPKARIRRKKRRQRLKVKTAVHKKPGLRSCGGQIKFVPHFSR